METPSIGAVKRAACARCQRPLRACYCSALPPTALSTQRTRVVVLQHAREQRQRQAISSVPVLSHVLTSPASVDVIALVMETTEGESVSDALCAALHAQLDGVLLADDVAAVLVLFPHVDAKTLTAELVAGSDAPSSSRSDTNANGETCKKPVVLVVVDGTWAEAKKIVHHSRAYWATVAHDRRAWGHVFEYVCLDATAAGHGTATSSIYGELRKEPMAGCVSTLEAVALALRVLEPEPEAQALRDAMLHAFQAMVTLQSQFQQRGKAEQQAKHGGTPKPGSQTRPLQRQDDARDQSTTEHMEPRVSRGVVKPYVFYTTHTDFRKRQRLVMEGDARLCTRDEAIARCAQLNRDRKRGDRVSTLPEDAFRRQQQRDDPHQQ